MRPFRCSVYAAKYKTEDEVNEKLQLSLCLYLGRNRKSLLLQAIMLSSLEKAVKSTSFSADRRGSYIFMERTTKIKRDAAGTLAPLQQLLSRRCPGLPSLCRGPSEPPPLPQPLRAASAPSPSAAAFEARAPRRTGSAGRAGSERDSAAPVPPASLQCC